MAGSFACEGSLSPCAYRVWSCVASVSAAGFFKNVVMSSDKLPSTRGHGFSLLDWLVLLAALSVVALLTLGGSHGWRDGISAKRNRTIAGHYVIKSGLEQYMEEHGQYPTPSNPDAIVKVSGKEMRVGAARMLYQVLMGDGDSEIKSGGTNGRVSDGKVSEEEAEDSINANLPKSMVATSSEGYRYLVDGWGHPFQYVKGDGKDAINPTYDLWSFGDVDSGSPLSYDVDTRRKAEEIAKWIRNW